MTTAAILAHEVIGSGAEKVIVLGGWLGDRGVFQPIQHLLDQDKFTYCFADPRGYGGSMDIAGQHTNAEVAGDVVALAAALGWDKFHFIGHSMMGKVAQYLCAHHGDRLKAVVGVCPVPACHIDLDAGGHQLFSTAWEIPANRGTICMVTTGNRNTPVWEQYMIRESLRTTTPEAFRDYFTMWAGEDFAADMPGCQTPFLAMTGEYDGGVPTAFVQATVMQWLPNAELHVMSNSGHYPMQETPIQFVTVCEAFLGRFA